MNEADFLGCEVQYCQSRERLWVHSYADGSTVGRFNIHFGMDIHHSLEEQERGKGQCLDCTHGKPDRATFERFKAYARDVWGVEIDESMLKLEVLKGDEPSECRL